MVQEQLRVYELERVAKMKVWTLSYSKYMHHDLKRATAVEAAVSILSGAACTWIMELEE